MGICPLILCNVHEVVCSSCDLHVVNWAICGVHVWSSCDMLVFNQVPTLINSLIH